MVEALITPNLESLDPSSPQYQALKSIQNHTLVIPSTDIARFLEQVEEEMDG